MKKELFNKEKIIRESILTMQILNINENSFSGDGILKKEDIRKKVKKAIKEEVNIFDIGAQSTRPGAKKINEKVELENILNTIKIIKEESRNLNKNIFVSIDTFDAKVAEACIKAGADIVNDISGGSFDQNMLTLMSKNKDIYYILSHIQGDFNSMHKKYEYSDIILELINYFENKINYMQSIGIKKEQIIIDPGFGFSKRKEENMEIIENIDLIVKKLNIPVLIGISRKKFVQDITKENEIDLDINTFLLEQIIINKLQNKNIIFRNHENKYLLAYLKIKKELSFNENISYSLKDKHIKNLLDKDIGITVIKSDYQVSKNFLKAVKREINYDMHDSPTIGAVYQKFSQKSIFSDINLIDDFKKILERDILTPLTEKILIDSKVFDDTILQHYKHDKGSVSLYAIPPHQDQKGFVGVVAVLLVSGDSNFYIAKNREGTGERKIEANPGDIILMRGYNFADIFESDIEKLPRPIHYIKSLKEGESRVSLGFRQYTKDIAECEKLINSYK